MQNTHKYSWKSPTYTYLQGHRETGELLGVTGRLGNRGESQGDWGVIGRHRETGELQRDIRRLGSHGETLGSHGEHRETGESWAGTGSYSHREPQGDRGVMGRHRETGEA